MKKTFKMPVTWEVCGFVDVEADSLEEAIDKFEENCDNYELPENGEYVDGSFGLTDNDPEFIKIYNQ